MRVTIDIPDSLHRNLKATAKREGRSMKEIVLRGIEKEMTEKLQPKRRIQFPLIRGKGKRKIKLTNAEIEDILFG